MIERELPRGPQTKICKRPSCGVPFSRTPNMKQENWENLEYCSRHRGYDKRSAGVELGHYIVTHPLIDKFITGQLA